MPKTFPWSFVLIMSQIVVGAPADSQEFYLRLYLFSVLDVRAMTEEVPDAEPFALLRTFFFANVGDVTVVQGATVFEPPTPDQQALSNGLPDSFISFS